MADLARMQQQCARLERTLASPFNGEIELLRTARTLRRIHGNLRNALMLYARQDGWTEEAAKVQTVLDVIEADLRQVLLGYPQVKGQQLRRYVHHALERSVEVLNLLADCGLPACAV